MWSLQISKNSLVIFHPISHLIIIKIFKNSKSPKISSTSLKKTLLHNQNTWGLTVKSFTILILQKIRSQFLKKFQLEQDMILLILLIILFKIKEISLMILLDLTCLELPSTPQKQINLPNTILYKNKVGFTKEVVEEWDL